MPKKIEQNQLVNLYKLLREGKIDLAIKIADDNIKNKISPTQFLKFIKKTLIKNKIVDKNPSILKLENIFYEKNFACAKYYFQINAKNFFKTPKALLIAGRVHFELDELNELYNCLDLYIVSSRIEGGPQAIFECAITKTPIISTDVGIASEILANESIFTMENFSNAIPNIDIPYQNVIKYKIPMGLMYLWHADGYLNIELPLFFLDLVFQSL